MTLPTYDELMFPLLELASDESDHEVSASMNSLAQKLGVTPAERAILQLAGSGFLFNNRFGWAKTYTLKAGLLQKTKRGWFRITPAGQQFVKEKLSKGERRTSWQELDQRFPTLHQWLYDSRASAVRGVGLPTGTAQPATSAPQAARIQTATPPPVASAAVLPSGSMSASPTVTTSATPEDVISEAISKLDSKLLDELKGRLAECDPTVFEVLITRLLVKMGYANNEEEILQLHGFSGDGGIDGRVKRDPLGLNQVYVQAKRWASPVPLAPVTEFFERVNEEKGRVGVFVARSGFNKDATNYITKPSHQQNVAWIDGDRLARLLIEQRVGIREEKAGRVILLSIDENAFEVESD